MPAESKQYNPSQEIQLQGTRYIDVQVSPEDIAASSDYLMRAPRAQVIQKDLGDTARIDIAIHDTIFSNGRPTHALGGIRVAPNGWKLAPELGADMETKYLALQEMFEQGNAPEAIREAARHDGGKAVLWAQDPDALRGERRTAIMNNIGHFIRELDGLYVPGADLGTSEDDLLTIAQAAGKGVAVACKKGDIPTSEITAVSVHHAFRALVDHKKATSGRPQLWTPDNIQVTFQGVGHVGQPLLIDMFQTHPGMKFILAEPKKENIEAVVEVLRTKGVTKAELQGRIAVLEDPSDPRQLYGALRESHVFMPNAIAGQVNLDTLSHMPEGSAYVGAGNDIIPKIGYADDPVVLAQALRKGITGVAAYQANCGGIGAIAVQDTGGTIEDAKRYMEGVYPMVKETLTEAHRLNLPAETVAAHRAFRHFAQFVKANRITL